MTSRGLAYFVAVSSPLAAVALEAVFRAYSENVPYVPFFLVVCLSAWVGGWWPGLASILVSAGAGYWLMHSSATADHVSGALVSACIFVPVALLAARLAALARLGFLEREDLAEEQSERAEALRVSERRLLEAVRARDDFISVASHEFKTPLTSAQMRVESLVRRCAEGSLARDAQLVRAVTVLDRQMRRLGTLVTNVLDVSRIGAGQLSLDLADVDLSELVDEVVAQWTDQLEPPVAPIAVAAARPVRGRWDRDRLAQVIVNLVSNAVKYGEGKPVLLSVERADAFARLVVEDHGLGIAPEDQERVFERFERATQSGSGLGVGLWVARELVAAHRGTIGLESALGRGSRFTVLLPLDPSKPGLTTSG